MNRLEFTRLARRDLREIGAFIAKDSRTMADRFVRRLEDKCVTLAKSPHLGYPVDELAVGLRVWPVRRYLIFYRLLDDGIEIIRVVHGARDIPSLFESP